ncbi:uncharacterized acetyltransferase At3g50280 [Gossypium raimondii]|uniref:HXXXD-type acyl-transferase family protein n=1 Tax=Gossypium raimondii TaxID=29730 RepID=A0A7J8PMM6_GOSRA|nr:uncharacterized acetyltransferase At3g50280 [Gossypium raimondii]MBA0590535.1 hypothetical protein [Gossypium raimondii]
MADVRFISSSIVQAANHSASSERIELTPWDLRFLQIGHIQKGLLFPKPKAPLQENDTENTLIHHLKTSLSHTLRYFPPLAGRLATTQHEDDTISFFIDCNNAGASFTHAVADGVTISDIIKPVYVPTIIHSFFPLNGLANFEGTRNPVLGIQVTDLADGIFIGCTINHVVVDGTSFWHFLNSWSEISKGSIHLSKPPVFQRWFPDDTDIPIRIPRSAVKLKQSNEELESILPGLKERVFHFSKENIAKLKAKANTEMGTNISSLQALLSHIWRSVIRNKRFDPNEETTYRVVVGVRPRLPELPDNYFGNAILGVLVTMKAKELLEQGTGNAAWTMNRKIATVTEESSKMFFESWTASPKFVTMITFKSNGLTTSSSPRFNMYGNDFGWGKPIAVRSGSGNKFEGKTTLFCGAEEGSIDIEVCLFPETMEALAIDEEIMDAVTL